VVYYDCRSTLAFSKNPKGRLAAQAAFCSRENSSNGVQNRQNFLAKSYEPPKRGVKIFFNNNCLIFQLFTNNVISRTRNIKMGKTDQAGSDRIS
jgi:hypothetical protein